MMMRESMRAWVLIGALILLSAVCPSHAKEVYKWVDEKGTIHFSEDESSVPEEYREQAEKKSVPEESKQPEEKVKGGKQDGKGAKDRLAVREKERINRNKIEGDVIESVKTILSLWKDGKYNAMYDHGDQKSRRAVNREDFERRMVKKGIGLASSWETIRDIEVDVSRVESQKRKAKMETRNWNLETGNSKPCTKLPVPSTQSPAPRTQSPAPISHGSKITFDAGFANSSGLNWVRRKSR